MRHPDFPPRARFMTAVFLFVAAASTAHAGPITPLYTLTDLGTSGGVTNGEVYNSSGQAVAPFPQTYMGTWIPTPANFPLLDPPPNISGAVPNTYSSSTAVNVQVYPNGMAVASDQVGVSSPVSEEFSWERTDIYYAMRNANGSWGNPLEIVRSATDIGTETGSNVGVQYSKSGNFLITTAMVPGIYAPGNNNDLVVYNINTHTSTDLATLPAITAGGYWNLILGSIDDQGRIVLTANSDPGGQFTTDRLLLTPTGLSPNPIVTAAPEPGSWAVMALAMAALAGRRLWARRSRSEA